MFKNSFATLFFFATVFSSLVLKKELNNAGKPKTSLYEDILTAKAIQKSVAEYLDRFIENEPKSKPDTINDFFASNSNKKTNKRTILGQGKKIWQQNTRDMDQLSRCALIGIFSAAYIYSLASLVVSVVVFVLVLSIVFDSLKKYLRFNLMCFKIVLKIVAKISKLSRIISIV